MFTSPYASKYKFNELEKFDHLSKGETHSRENREIISRVYIPLSIR